MAYLVNISGESKLVGGWEKDINRGLQSGRVMSLPTRLEPGESKLIPDSIVNHPIIVDLVNSGAFKLTHVQLIPGGEIDVNPAVPPIGLVKKLVSQFTHADLTAAAVTESLDMGAIPPGAYILDVVAVSEAAWETGAMAIVVGSAGNDDLISGSMNVDVAAGVSVPGAFTGTAQAKYFPDGIDVVVKFTSDVNVVDLTAGSFTLHILYCLAE